jgi:hypothetical protein
LIKTIEKMQADIAAAFQIPEHRLFAQATPPASWTMHYNERDVHRYYVHINAIFKGARRRARRQRNYIKKMVLKYRS